VSEIAVLLRRPALKPDCHEDFDFKSFDSSHRPLIIKQFNIGDENIESIRPCTPVQSGMLALFLSTNGDCYFNRILLRSSVPLKKAHLRQSWLKIVERHEILRTGFVQLKNPEHPFAMVTYRKGTVALPWYDSAYCDTLSDSDSRIKDLCNTFHRPPWHITIKDSDSATFVEFCALHAIYDAHSLEHIFSDVSAAYDGKELPDIVPNDAVLNLILTASSSQNSEIESYWKNLLQETPVLKFPDLTPHRVDNVKLLTSRRFCSKLHGLIGYGCRTKGITLQAAGQAAWARLLSAYTGEIVITFGLVLSGRHHSLDAQEVVFPCLVTVPSTCRVQGSNRDLVASIMRANAMVTKVQFTPLQKIHKWLDAKQKLFDTLFVYQRFANREKSKPWEIVEDDAKIDVCPTFEPTWSGY
jgi:ferricrocin synthase